MQSSRGISLLIVVFIVAAILMLPGTGTRGQATPENNWTAAAGELATKIAAQATKSAPVALTVRNASSLADDEVVQIHRALRVQLRSRGLRLSTRSQASVVVEVTLSENTEGFLWVAEIGNGLASGVSMVAVARPKPGSPPSVVEPLTIRTTRLYGQDEPFLDFVPLDSLPGAPARALVLGLDSVALCEQAQPAEQQAANWQCRQSAPYARFKPWPRDPRGRLIVRSDDRFDVYLPGETCSGTLVPALSVDCRESGDPWPLGGGADGSPGAAAYYAPDRNSFDGRIRMDDGRDLKVAPFFTAAPLPPPSDRTRADTAGAMWVLAGTDGRALLVGNNSESLASFSGWGSNLASLRSGCRSGWQILATQAGDFNEPDAIAAYEIVNRKAMVASPPIEFGGPVVELRSLADGPAAIAISHNLNTASYEAFRLSMSCGQ